jgi:hypothetical protein
MLTNGMVKRSIQLTLIVVIKDRNTLILGGVLGLFPN